RQSPCLDSEGQAARGRTDDEPITPRRTKTRPQSEGQGWLICEFVESDQPPWFHPWYRHAIRGKQNSAKLPTDGMAIPRMNEIPSNLKFFRTESISQPW